MWSWAAREQRLSFDRVSSVDYERGSGRESRFVAGQVQHRVGDVFGILMGRDLLPPVCDASFCELRLGALRRLLP